MAENGYNVIFLDIDSVCNHSRKAETAYDGEYPDGWFIADGVPLCTDNVKALKSIIRGTENPAIVWSTDWRLFNEDTWHGWKNPLKWLESEGGLKSYVIGNTPKKMSSNRHEEIMMWLRDEDRPAVANFAILDDIEYGMEMFHGHFFKCDYDRGLVANIADAVTEFLSVPADDMGIYSSRWRTYDKDNR